MRALKTILIILLSLVGLWLALSAFGPKESNVERSTVINARPDLIYDHVRYLKNMDEWGVWRKSDVDAKYEMSGEDGTVGAKQSWDGDTVMQGSQTITALEPNKSVKSDLAFGNMMVSQLALDLSPVDGGTEVKWSLHADIPFQYRGMMLFMGMGDGVGKDFETGLANLKTICEVKQVEADKNVAATTFEITSGDRPAMLYFGERKRLKWSAMKEFYAATFGKAYGVVTSAGIQPAGAPSAVLFEWDVKNQEADLMAAIPVPAEAKNKLKGMSLYETPASKTYTIAYLGGYTGIGKAHEAMDARMAADGVTMNANVIEEYVTDPGTEPDSTKWLTNVVYLIK